MASGIYKIKLVASAKCYVGSAIKISVRWSAHRMQLRNNKHHSVKLQRAWNKYGEAAFEFSVIELVGDKMDLLRREQYWIDTLNSYAEGFNVAPNAGSSLGVRHTGAYKKAVGDRRRGQVASAETIAKMSAASRGRLVSEETRQKLRIANTGRRFPESFKEMAREASTGKKASPETRAKMSAAHAGKPMSAHVKEAISVALIEHYKNPEAKERLMRNLPKSHSAEAKRRIGDARRGLQFSDEWRANLSAALKGRARPAHLVEQSAAAIRGRKRPQHVVDAIAAANRATFARKREARELSKQANACPPT